MKSNNSNTTHDEIKQYQTKTTQRQPHRDKQETIRRRAAGYMIRTPTQARLRLHQKHHQQQQQEYIRTHNSHDDDDEVDGNDDEEDGEWRRRRP